MPIVAKLNSPSDPDEPRPRRRRLRSVSTLPTLLTLGNLVSGFAAIHFCMSAIADMGAGRPIFEKATLNSQLVESLLPSFISCAGFMILLGMFFDMVDGRLARITTRTSNFGGQLDSLADMVTFGVAPAVLMITLLTRLPEAHLVALPGRAVWVVAAIYACCTGLRLAKFNVEHAGSHAGHTSFHGLPSPGAAAVVASLVILHQLLFHSMEHPEASVLLANIIPWAVLAVALLMVSRVRYVHLGNVYLKGRRPFEQVVVFLIALGVFLWHPVPTLTVFVCGYAVSGPIQAGARRLRAGRYRGSARVPAPPPAEEESSAPGERSA
jgi:CDP-diacylglycerol--serine O-phosphatidyltransferase